MNRKTPENTEKNTAVQTENALRAGVIVKGVGGFYTVRSEDGGCCVCKARGLFRKQNVTPAVGDMAEYSVSGGADGADPSEQDPRFEAKGWLVRILPRKNELIRPAVSNIDILIIVLSASKPEPDLLLADKLLLMAAKHGIEPMIVINKCDEADGGSVDHLKNQYAHANCPVFAVSARTGEGTAALYDAIKGRVICLAGQSAVGKSSLLNSLIPGISLKVGSLSEKTERGRHTTRHTELIPLPGGGAVLDTPGFSLLETLELEPEEIKNLYPELAGEDENCRFTGCLHITEPGCYVKKNLILPHGAEGVERGIPRERYERYVRLVKEAEEHRRHRYD